MPDNSPPKFILGFTLPEMQIIVYALSSMVTPYNREFEEIQYKLYQRLLAKLNEGK